MILRHLFLIIMIALAGCAHQGRITAPPNVLAQQELLQTIAQWEVNGKLGIRTADDSGSASLKWAQTEKDYRINLSGPLGQKHIAITGTPHKVTLEESGRPPLSAQNAESLIKQAVGWTLPVTQLAYWIRGVPAPREKITSLQANELGLVAQLEQGGWTIQYSNYRNWDIEGKQVAMPQKIIAQYHDVRLILAIRDWHMSTPE